MSSSPCSRIAALADGEVKIVSVARAFGVAALGIFLFSGMDALMKRLTLDLGAYNAMLWRVLAGATIGGVVYLAVQRKRPSKAAMRFHATRGLLSSVMAFLFFWGLARVPLAEGIALSFIAPLIALYLAAVVLKEKVGAQAILASLLGLAGVGVILLGRTESGSAADLKGVSAILASAALYAWNIVLMRQQALVAKPAEVAFFTGLVVSLCYLPFAPFLARLPGLDDLPAILLSAVLGFSSLMLLSWAYARAQAQHLAPVEYTAFLWASIFGLLFFGERLKPVTAIGALMIVGACLAATRRSRRSAIEAEAALPGGYA